MEGIPAWARGRLRLGAALAGAAALLFLCHRLVLQALALTAGGGVFAFLALPLARVFEGRLSRPRAALAAMLALGAALLGMTALALPTLARELTGLAQALPAAAAAMTAWASRLTDALARAGITLPPLPHSLITGRLPRLASGTVALATGAAEAVGAASMMAVLGCFLLAGRDGLALRLELLIPRAARGTAVRMGRAVGRELRLYLRAQLLIALSVSLLATALLALLRVRGPLVLGPLVGLFNMIPYVGPLIGGAPAVLIALGDGPVRALMAVGALCLVQQLDGAVISPRIMGAVTGLSPAVSLVAVFAAARLAGLAGMLFAVPVLIIIRTLFRVYVQRAENI